MTSNVQNQKISEIYDSKSENPKYVFNTLESALFIANLSVVNT